MSIFKWVKWSLIITWSEVVGKTTVNFFGGTYVVAGNIVKRIR